MPALRRLHHRGENGQQQPGADIVNRCARDSRCSQVCYKQIALFQNPAEYRVSGDAHCRLHEESERRKWNLLSGKLRIEPLARPKPRASGKTGPKLLISTAGRCFRMRLRSTSRPTTNMESRPKLT